MGEGGGNVRGVKRIWLLGTELSQEQQRQAPHQPGEAASAPGLRCCRQVLHLGTWGHSMPAPPMTSLLMNGKNVCTRYELILIKRQTNKPINKQKKRTRAASPPRQALEFEMQTVPISMHEEQGVEGQCWARAGLLERNALKKGKAFLLSETLKMRSENRARRGQRVSLILIDTRSEPRPLLPTCQKVAFSSPLCLH